MKSTFLKISFCFLVMAGAGSVFPTSTSTIPAPEIPKPVPPLVEKSNQRPKPPPLPAFPITYETDASLAQHTADVAQAVPTRADANSDRVNLIIEAGSVNQSASGSSSNFLFQSSDSIERTVAMHSQSVLSVPKIGVQSSIVSVPLVDGFWSVDDLGSDIGMLGGVGRFPQDEQSMVFAAHVTTFWPIAGPFAYLDRLLPNDEIAYVHENRKYVYEVTRLLYVEPGQVNHLLNDNGDQIILVTCGYYNVLQGDFEKRLLVIADLIDIQPIPFN